jgi:hypothetical protein
VYRLYHPATHRLFKSFHVKFIEQKDDVSRPLYPDHIIDLPSTDPTADLSDGNPPVPLIPLPSIPSSTYLPTSTAPKHTLVQDEEESFDDLPHQVWTVPNSEIEVPVPPHIHHTDVVPVPAVIDAHVPRCSACVQVPSSKMAEVHSIKHVPCVAQAVAESCEVGCRLKEQHAQAKFGRRQQVLDLRASLTNVTPSPSSTPIIPAGAIPDDSKILCGKWVLLLKQDEHGNAVRHKARFVVKGFEQVFGQDYVDTTSPTAHMESVRLLLNIATTKDWDIQQIDVKTAFLYGLLPPDEVQYLEQPESFAEPSKEDWVWCLQRGLYGMKQSGHIWNKTMHKAMLGWGFKRLHADPCVYYRVSSLGVVLSAVHVDDFLIVSSTPDASHAFKEELKSLWTISDLGEAHFCIGIAISHNCVDRTISISQTALIDRVV